MAVVFKNDNFYDFIFHVFQAPSESSFIVGPKLQGRQQILTLKGMSLVNISSLTVASVCDIQAH